MSEADCTARLTNDNIVIMFSLKEIIMKETNQEGTQVGSGDGATTAPTETEEIQRGYKPLPYTLNVRRFTRTEVAAMSDEDQRQYEADVELKMKINVWSEMLSKYLYWAERHGKTEDLDIPEELLDPDGPIFENPGSILDAKFMNTILKIERYVWEKEKAAGVIDAFLDRNRYYDWRQGTSPYQVSEWPVAFQIGVPLQELDKLRIPLMQAVEDGSVVFERVPIEDGKSPADK